EVPAVGSSAGYLEHMTRRRRGCRRRRCSVSIKPTDRRVADWQVRSRYRGVERNTKNGAIRQNRVIASHIHPGRLRLNTGAEVKADPDLTVICANDGHALILRRVLDLVDKPHV